MSRTILYTFNDEEKTLVFSYQEYRSAHEAVAAAEGIDLTSYLKMEQQIEAISDTKSMRNYRDNHFRKLGFSHITLKPKENVGIGKKPTKQ